MIATVSPGSSAAEDTLNTLRYAQRVKVRARARTATSPHFPPTPPPTHTTSHPHHLPPTPPPIHTHPSGVFLQALARLEAHRWWDLVTTSQGEFRAAITGASPHTRRLAVATCVAKVCCTRCRPRGRIEQA